MKPESGLEQGENKTRGQYTPARTQARRRYIHIQTGADEKQVNQNRTDMTEERKQNLT